VTSYNDADAIYSFLTEHLGYRPDNILDVRDAKKADLERLFGREPGLEGISRTRRPAQCQGARLLFGARRHRRRQNETYLLRSIPRLFGTSKAATSCRRSMPISPSLTPGRCSFCWRRYGRDHGPMCCRPTCPRR
jgi:hypothetical protein